MLALYTQYFPDFYEHYSVVLLVISVISLNEINESEMEHELHLFIFRHCLLCLLVRRFLTSVKFKPQIERKKSGVWKKNQKSCAVIGTAYSEGFDERGWLWRLHKPNI